MEEEFLLYPEALALKELGFLEPVFAYFKKEKHKENPEWLLFPSGDPDIQVRYQQGLQNSFPELELISGPTYSQAFRWFRKKYKFRITITEHHENGCSIVIYKDFINSVRLYCNTWTYEEAELACLKKLIEVAKRKTD
jgi:hypothetical protein